MGGRAHVLGRAGVCPGAYRAEAEVVGVGQHDAAPAGPELVHGEALHGTLQAHARAAHAMPCHMNARTRAAHTLIHMHTYAHAHAYACLRAA